MWQADAFPADVNLMGHRLTAQVQDISGRSFTVANPSRPTCGGQALFTSMWSDEHVWAVVEKNEYTNDASKITMSLVTETNCATAPEKDRKMSIIFDQEANCGYIQRSREYSPPTKMPEREEQSFDYWKMGLYAAGLVFGCILGFWLLYRYWWSKKEASTTDVPPEMGDPGVVYSPQNVFVQQNRVAPMGQGRPRPRVSPAPIVPRGPMRPQQFF